MSLNEENKSQTPTMEQLEYNMQHKNRGMALIFNHSFERSTRYKERLGTEKDCTDLSKTLEKLHFKVKIHKDCEYETIKRHMKEVAEKDHTDNDCIVIAILTHGSQHNLEASDKPYKLENIAQYLTNRNCPSLIGKPRLFFIQACRGTATDPGTSLKNPLQTDSAPFVDYTAQVLDHRDFLYAYSTIPRFVSWRNSQDGSWFIQSLVGELKNNGEIYDIMILLTFVNKRVALEYESWNPKEPDLHEKKQMPCVRSMLTRLLHFTDNTSLFKETSV